MHKVVGCMQSTPENQMVIPTMQSVNGPCHCSIRQDLKGSTVKSTAFTLINGKPYRKAIFLLLFIFSASFCIIITTLTALLKEWEKKKGHNIPEN